MHTASQAGEGAGQALCCSMQRLDSQPCKGAWVSQPAPVAAAVSSPGLRVTPRTQGLTSNSETRPAAAKTNSMVWHRIHTCGSLRHFLTFPTRGSAKASMHFHVSVCLDTAQDDKGRGARSFGSGVDVVI